MTSSDEQVPPAKISESDFQKLLKKHNAVSLDTSNCRWVNGIYVCDLVGFKVALTDDQFRALSSVKK